MDKIKQIKYEMDKDFAKRSVIKRIQHNLNVLKQREIDSGEIKSNESRFKFIVEPSLDYYNKTGEQLTSAEKEHLLIWAYENSKQLFDY